MKNIVTSIDYWASQPTDKPWSLNGFNGTFAYSDHDLIPEPIKEFLIEYFYDRLGEMRKGHVKVVPLNEINDLMNKVWDGPGSMPKLVSLMNDMRHSRRSQTDYDTKDPLKGYEIPTIESDLGENVVDRLEE